jgi:hypothetical protein
LQYIFSNTHFYRSSVDGILACGRQNVDEKFDLDKASIALSLNEIFGTEDRIEVTQLDRSEPAGQEGKLRNLFGISGIEGEPATSVTFVWCKRF